MSKQSNNGPSIHRLYQEDGGRFHQRYQSQRRRIYPPSYDGMPLMKTYTMRILVQLYSTIVQGHSLGGAYSILCFTELMRLFREPTPSLSSVDSNPFSALTSFEIQLSTTLKTNNFVLQDCHSFGAPRIGGWTRSGDWAKAYNTAVASHQGKSWRVANEWDPVVDIPPVVPFISWWHHVDEGWMIGGKDGAPRKLKSEIGTQPGVSLKPWNFAYHRECCPRSSAVSDAHQNHLSQKSRRILSAFTVLRRGIYRRLNLGPLRTSMSSVWLSIAEEMPKHW